MATFRFELNGRPTKNKTYVVYLRVTVGGKRKLIKTMVELARPSDFNAKCKGENWVRGGVRDAKVLNAQLADILAKAKDTYKELDKEGRGYDCCTCQRDEHRDRLSFFHGICKGAGADDLRQWRLEKLV